MSLELVSLGRFSVRASQDLGLEDTKFPFPPHGSWLDLSQAGSQAYECWQLCVQLDSFLGSYIYLFIPRFELILFLSILQHFITFIRLDYNLHLHSVIYHWCNRYLLNCYYLSSGSAFWYPECSIAKVSCPPSFPTQSQGHVLSRLDLSNKLALLIQPLPRGLFFSLLKLLIKVCSVAAKSVSQLVEVNIIKKANEMLESHIIHRKGKGTPETGCLVALGEYLLFGRSLLVWTPLFSTHELNHYLHSVGLTEHPILLVKGGTEKASQSSIMKREQGFWRHSNLA